MSTRARRSCHCNRLPCSRALTLSCHCGISASFCSLRSSRGKRSCSSGARASASAASLTMKCVQFDSDSNQLRCFRSATRVADRSIGSRAHGSEPALAIVLAESELLQHHGPGIDHSLGFPDTVSAASADDAASGRQNSCRRCALHVCRFRSIRR